MNSDTLDIVIFARDLVKKFDDFEAVRGVTFSVKRGECFGLLGPPVPLVLLALTFSVLTLIWTSVAPN
ncbi:hypothetical protein [Phosphitispora sp. TUW77]|uniref:hypothetical protein n=1 Tax=Phosphitispora sp. TUW77 TaxID=3152361 RepID=UPI003AB6FF33